MTDSDTDGNEELDHRITNLNKNEQMTEKEKDIEAERLHYKWTHSLRHMLKAKYLGR